MGKGLDVGTATFVVTDKDGSRFQRNTFIQLDADVVSTRQLKQMQVPYVTIGKKLYVVGTKAFELANVFNNSELRRPMSSGVLNPIEQDALPILRTIVEGLLGKPEGSSEEVIYCIPAKPIDKQQEISYHEDVFKNLIESLGYKAKSINEAVALAYAGLSAHNLTGISISCGAGMQNIAIMYQGIPALTFSVSKSGDWIDENVSRDCGITKAKAQYIKEKNNYSIAPSDDSEREREQNAIKTYYESLVRYVLANIEKQFTSTSMPNFPEAVPIVIGGGTSMVKGFIDVFKSQFVQKSFPIEISEIKLVDEPFIAVSKGCYIDAQLNEEA